MNKRKGINGLLITTVSVIAAGFTSTAIAGGGGEVYLHQTGDSQTATINQSGGTSDTVGASGTPFLQENGAGSGHNVLTINQNSAGTSELSNIGDYVHTGSGNAVTGFQSGSDNSAEIDQMGNNSSVNLEQTGNNNGPSDAGWFNLSYGNLILQDATANGSTVNLIQKTKSAATNGNVFSIGQGGANNDISASQTGYNKLWIRQGTQAPDLWGWTHGNPFDPANTPNSLSALSNSSITVNQTVGGADPSGRNYAALGQGHGSGDSISVTQTGASNAADVNQIGSNNIFISTQTSTNANTDWNFVGGEAGWPDVTPDPLVGPNGDYQPITQTGIGNEYYSTQLGTNQWAFGSQTGNYNFLNSTQSGDKNSLYTKQLGNSNEIYASQDGDQNTATVSQTHNGSLTNVTQSGTSNMATVTQ